MTTNTPKVEINIYTDPYCTWCWGSEPILRHLEEAYGDQITFRNVMGGLVEDISQFHDASNDIGGPDFAKQVAEHWDEASGKHGMPVDSSQWTDTLNEFTSTHPANIAYKAAQLTAPELADRFLRRLREGAAFDHRMIHQLEVQTEIADEVGIDTESFKENMASGAAVEAFRKDREECAEYGIRGFPTYIVRDIREDGGKGLLLRGYRQFDQFTAAISDLGVELEEKKLDQSQSTVEAFARKYGRIAPREIEETFGITAEEAKSLLDSLVEEGGLVKRGAGTGRMYVVV